MSNTNIPHGNIETLAFGGKGVVKSKEEGVTFISFTAPHDSIEFKQTLRKKNYAEGEMTKLIKAGPGRIEPRCPYYFSCGGCQLQHIGYKQQLEYKRNAVIDALRRIGKVTFNHLPEIVPATSIWEYRRHITLTIRPSESGFTAGYISTDQENLLPVNECSIFVSQENPIFDELSEVLKEFENSRIREGRVTIIKTDHSKFLLYFIFNKLPRNGREILNKALLKYPTWQGAIASDKRNEISVGNPLTEINVEGYSFCFSPYTFIQTHPEQSHNIYRDTIQLASNVKGNILDLYCGIGITSLLLAKKAQRVLGIEYNHQSINLAKKNALCNLITNVHFIASDVKSGLSKWLREEKPELVLLNPPRGGLDMEVTKQLIEGHQERLLYISCMPPTLARDTALLCKAGYKLKTCRIYDMFPQTSHVETLVELTKK